MITRKPWLVLSSCWQCLIHGEVILLYLSWCEFWKSFNRQCGGRTLSFLGKERSRKLQLQSMKLVSLKLDYLNSNLYIKKFLLECLESVKADFVFWWGNKNNNKCKGGIADVQQRYGLRFGVVMWMCHSWNNGERAWCQRLQNFRMPWVHRKHLDFDIHVCNGTDKVVVEFIKQKSLTN